MLEQLKNKFEEKYQSWKDYKSFIENNDKELAEKQKEFSKRVQNLETKEQIEEYFQLQGEPSKHMNDISVLSNNLVELYRLLEPHTEFPKEVKEDIEKIPPLKTYYFCKDAKLQKVNEDLHQQLEDNFYANIENMLDARK